MGTEKAERTASSGWFALDVQLEPAGREAVEYALMEAGALGTETNEDNPIVCITAYFNAVPDRELVRAALAESFQIHDVASSAVTEMKVREVENRDWLGEWKKSWQPVEVGRFIIAPPWSDVQSIPDRLIIRIEPGMAFGTGTHETTRLCLAAIEKYFAGGSLLDVGTGTGILAIAAAKLFPSADITAWDLDEDAVAIARENAEANNVSNSIVFHTGSVDDATASTDLLVANLTADVILRLLPVLLKLTCGRLILSGILQEQVDAVLARLRECGVTENCEILQNGEWVCIIV